MAGLVPAQFVPAQDCSTFRVGFVPLDVLRVVFSRPDPSGDLVVVGTVAPGTNRLETLPEPNFVDQLYCDPIELLPGIDATAYVPSVLERAGDFSSFGAALPDPQAPGEVFSGNMIPMSRLPAVFAWRVASFEFFSLSPRPLDLRASSVGVRAERPVRILVYGPTGLEFPVRYDFLVSSTSPAVSVAPTSFSLEQRQARLITVRWTPDAIGPLTEQITVTRLLNGQQLGSNVISVIGTAAPGQVTFTGIDDVLAPVTQPAVGVELDAPAAAPLTGRLAMTFDGEGELPDDPMVQLLGGNREVGFTVPAGGTRSVFAGGANGVGFQTGTVAGTIEFRLSELSASGISVNAVPEPTRSAAVQRLPPTITRVTATSQSGSAFGVVVVGFSTPRDMVSASFTFTARSGVQFTTSVFTGTADIVGAFGSWYQGNESVSFGSQFQLTDPFTVVEGRGSDLQSVSVTLTNSAGASAPVSAAINLP